MKTSRSTPAWLALLIAFPLSACDRGARPGSDAGPPPGGCPVGAEGCACRPGDVCDDGLVCSEATCASDTPTGLGFPPGAAGCELLLVEESGALHVTFGAGTRGTFVREAPQVAVVLTGDTLSAEVRGGTFTIESATCVDGTGAAVGGAIEVR